MVAGEKNLIPNHGRREVAGWTRPGSWESDRRSAFLASWMKYKAFQVELNLLRGDQAWARDPSGGPAHAGAGTLVWQEVILNGQVDEDSGQESGLESLRLESAAADLFFKHLQGRTGAYMNKCSTALPIPSVLSPVRWKR